jgi:6-phosphogluconate dehydrogenase
MVPAGEITGKTIEDLASHMESGDTIIDGGNSYYRDDIRRAASCPSGASTTSTAGRAAGYGGSTAATAS